MNVGEDILFLLLVTYAEQQTRQLQRNVSNSNGKFINAATILNCITRWKKTSWGESFNSGLNDLVAFVINNFVKID